MRAGALQPLDHGGVRASARYAKAGQAAVVGSPRDVDVVLDGDGNAVERTLDLGLLHQPARFRHHLGPIAQRDEDGRVVVGGDAREGALHRLHRRHGPGAMRQHDGSDGLGHASPRSGVQAG